MSTDNSYQEDLEVPPPLGVSLVKPVQHSAYLGCEWCSRSASSTVRLRDGKLTGICLRHRAEFRLEADDFGTYHIDGSVQLRNAKARWTLSTSPYLPENFGSPLVMVTR